VLDLRAELHDFADTAALIDTLDLVLSADTAVAHLAGALGKPVWLLDRYNSCWRWRAAAGSSPWYPTLRIFRQQRFGDWSDVEARLGSAFAAWRG
jgi:ADP-heptose:LPS heptosyltransferase